MSEYEKHVGFRDLQMSRSPRIEEIEALISHVEEQVANADEGSELMDDLLEKIKEKNEFASHSSSENVRAKDILVFQSAREFLYRESPEEITGDIITRYLSPEKSQEGSLSLPEIFRNCLETAANSSLNAKTVGRILGMNLELLKDILFKYEPRKVIEKYGRESEQLLEDIVKKVGPGDEINTAPKSPWYKYCRTIISAANFFSQFDNISDLMEWISRFSGDFRTVPALPLLLGKEIYGMGFTLACDFLIDLGLEDYCRVDSTVKKLLIDSGLLPPDSDGYRTLKGISRIAQNTGSSPYEVDKVFWLIGTGYFYNHLDLGKKERGTLLKNKFLASLSD